MPTMMRALSGQRVFRDFVNEHMSHVKDVWDKLAPHEAEIQNIKSTSDAINAASVVYKDIEDEDSLPSEDQDENSLSGKGSKGSKGGKGGGAKSSSKGESGEDEDEGDGEDEDESEGGGGEGEESEGDGDGSEGESEGEGSEGDESSDGESDGDSSGNDDGEGEEGEGDSANNVEDSSDSEVGSSERPKSDGKGNPGASKGFSEMLEVQTPTFRPRFLMKSKSRSPSIRRMLNIFRLRRITTALRR